MTKIHECSGLDDFPPNIVFDKILGNVYYFLCVYWGLSGCVSRLDETNSNSVFNSQKYSFTYIGIALVSKAFHRC